jgi:hypothetical protein
VGEPQGRYPTSGGIIACGERQMAEAQVLRFLAHTLSTL